MKVLEWLLLVVLLVSAVFIIVAVLMQKSNEDGLSGTIAGGQETFYGKDKSSHADRTIFILTAVAAVVFVLAVVAVYVIQPDYAKSFALDQWKSMSGYNYIFPTK